MIRPEVQSEIDATRAALARLRLAVCRSTPAEPREAKSPAQALAGQHLRALDDAFAVATGAPLDLKNAPPYDGPPVPDGPSRALTGVHVRYTVVGALARTRAGQPGCHPRTAELAARYFSWIWPASAPWPPEIERPAPRPGWRGDTQ